MTCNIMCVRTLPHSGSELRFLLQPQNATVLEGEPYSVECVALHTVLRYQYFISSYSNLFSAGSDGFLYPSSPGLPVRTVGSVSLREHDGANSLCYSGPSGYSLIPSRQSVLTVHSELIGGTSSYTFLIKTTDMYIK